MNSRKLARDYLEKARVRLEALDLFFERQRYDDVIRVAAQAAPDLELAVDDLFG